MSSLRRVRIWVLALLGLGCVCVPQSRLQARTNPATQTDPRQIPQRTGQHDFDFCLGVWNAQLKILQRPLTGSQYWVNYTGTVVVRKIWNGHAQLAELEVNGPSRHIEGLSLRLYNPQSRQWSIYFANSTTGALGTPMIGQFANGRGEFYDREEYQGRAVFVRFVFSDITSNSFHFEQAFSLNGGKNWEANWIGTFTREKY